MIFEGAAPKPIDSLRIASPVAKRETFSAVAVSPLSFSACEGGALERPYAAVGSRCDRFGLRDAGNLIRIDRFRNEAQPITANNNPLKPAADLALFSQIFDNRTCLGL
jgi:hypothetical protein